MSKTRFAFLAFLILVPISFVQGIQIPFGFFKSLFSAPPVVEGEWCRHSGGVYGKDVVASGACDWTYLTPGTYSWTAPEGVTSISLLLIGGGGAGHMSSISAAASAGGTSSAFGVKATGGNGTSGGGSAINNPDNITLSRTAEGQGGIGVGGDANFAGGNGAIRHAGGGGAAGYTQNGGDGVNTAANFGEGYGGGGVGIFGGVEGGAGGTPTAAGAGGSGGFSGSLNNGADYGGGGGSDILPGYSGGGRLASGGGGGLAYKNNISVVPGNTYTIIVGHGGKNNQGSGGGTGVVRILWGAGRAFPNTLTGASLASSTGYAVVDTNTTITDANKSSYENKDVIVASGITLTLDTNSVLNWSSLDMKDNAQITHTACTSTKCSAVNLNIAGNAYIASTAKIDVNGKGYLQGRTYGNTSTGGAGSYSGGSHGGYGGVNSGGYQSNETYGRVDQPDAPGAGGYLTGVGGGVVKLQVAGILILNGTITANGTNATSSYYGAGAGGSVWLDAGAFASSNAIVNITANGGAGTGGTANGGGGGRIAIHYGSLSGFTFDVTRLQAYGGTGMSGYNGGPGTIFSKKKSEDYGDLLISGPNYSSYKNTQVGVFGQVSSVSTSTLVSNAPLLPNTTESLAGKTLKPDITLPATVALASNAGTSLTAVGDLTTLTSTSKYFYVTDYQTQFKNVSIAGAARVDFGYLKASESFNIAGTSQVNVYDIEAKDTTFASGIYLNVRRKMKATGSSSFSTFAASTSINDLEVNNATFANTVLTIPVNLTAAGNVVISGSAVLGAWQWSVGGNITLNNSAVISIDSLTVAGDVTLNNTAKITTVTAGGMVLSGITITANNLNLTTSASIDGNGKGYLTGRTLGNTTMGGAPSYTGGSHGGYGGVNSGGYQSNEIYGSIEYPNAPGAGGSGSGAFGGGLIKITVASNFTLNGTVSANGSNATTSYYGGGAGGSVWITAGSITSVSSAVNITANGGAGTGGTANGGGGGRIAIHYGSLSGFVVNTNRVRAYGGTGMSGYNGGPGTIFSKQILDPVGDLLIAGPNFSSYKNNRIGTFGQVSSVAADVLESSVPLLPWMDNSLVGKILKPDITLPAVVPLLANTKTTLTANTSLGGLTSASKYFYVSNYETAYKSITLQGTAKVDSGYLNVSDIISVEGTTQLAAYDIDSNHLQLSSGTSVIVQRNVNLTGNLNNTGGTLSARDLTVSGNVVASGGTLTAVSGGSISVAGSFNSSGNLVTAGYGFEVGGNLTASAVTLTAAHHVTLEGPSHTVSGASVFNSPDWTVTGNLTLGDTTSAQLNSMTVGGDLVLNATSKITTTNASSSALYGITVVANNMTIANGASVDANGKGYIAGRTFGNVTTDGPTAYTGGSHGGYGGVNSGGYTATEVYGSIEQPVTAGSGGGGGTSAGGGVIKITVTSTLSLNGVVSANGVNVTTSSYLGAGAGGSIWITANTISSSNAIVNVTASGGAGTAGTSNGGGGGRIAIYYDNLSGFTLNTSRIRAYGGVGQSTYHGGPGTIYLKKGSDAYGELLIAGPNFSNFKNTKIGVFGQVSAVSTGTLTAGAAILPGTTESLAGRILKPDITQPGTASVVSSTRNTITADTDLSSLTAATKYFYVSDYETTYKNIVLQGVARVDAGYLKALQGISLEGTSQLHSYEIETDTYQMASGTTATVRRNMTSASNATVTSASLTTSQDLTVGGTLTTTSATLTTTGALIAGADVSVTGGTFNQSTLTVAGNFTASNVTSTTPGFITLNGSANVIGGTSSFVSPLWTVAGNLTLNNSASLQLETLNVTGDLQLTTTSKVTSANATTTTLYPISITAQNINLASGTSIDANGKGYLVGRTLGNTTTGGPQPYTGGSHGGYGGVNSGGYTVTEVYGSIEHPVTAGSGGGGGTAAGGGIIKLVANGTLTLNGIVTANGINATSSYFGASAGGSIWISANAITSSNAIVNITASGGAGTAGTANGGGGGRIAIYYGSLSGFTIDANRVRAYGGAGQLTYHGGAGSIYSKNMTSGQAALLISGGTRTSNYARTKITLSAPLVLETLKIESSALVRQTNNVHALTTNTLEIQSSGGLEVPTNGAAGYGAWFQYSTLVGSPAPTEY